MDIVLGLLILAILAGWVLLLGVLHADGRERRRATGRWRIFDLEHQLGIGGHNDGYSCMECWRLEDEDDGRL